MREIKVNLKRVMTYSLTIEIEDDDLTDDQAKSNAEDEAIFAVEEQGETPNNLHCCEADVVDVEIMT